MTFTAAAIDGVGESLSDNDYYKHNVTSYDGVNSLPSAVCSYDDADRRRCVEHIYESPKFDKRQIS